MSAGLRKISDARFYSDKEQSERAARASIEFILSQREALQKIKGGDKYLSDVTDISKSIELTPGQKDYIDTIYEKTMKALGFDSFSRTFKPKKNNLRFG